MSEGERSFWIVTRVNNHLWKLEQYGVDQRRLAALLCIDSDVLRERDGTELFDDFAKLKCRRRDLYTFGSDSHRNFIQALITRVLVTSHSLNVT